MRTRLIVLIIAAACAFAVTLNGPFVIRGLVTTYNNIVTAGWGVPAVYGAGRAEAQTDAVSSFATYTVGAADGAFWVTSDVNVTAGATYSFSVLMHYVDETNTTRNVLMVLVRSDGTQTQTVTDAIGNGVYRSYPVQLRIKGGTTVTVSTFGDFTDVTYNVEAFIVQIG